MKPQTLPMSRSPKFRAFVPAAAMLFCGVIFALLSGLLAPAQAQNDPQNFTDPPGRVGRLADTTGQVWLFTPEAGEWVTAARNRPLTTGDRLSTDASGRAEVRIGSTTVRLAAGTELEVLRLDDDHITLQLHNGSAAVRLRQREATDEFELKTAEGRFRTERTGRYRFDRTDDTSNVTVYSGQAHYEGPGSALTVNANQRAEFWLDGRNAAQYSITEPQRDSFGSWNSDRDRTDDRNASSRYVSPEMTGIEDLDRHGRWEQNTEYGALWTPRNVAPGWAPYAAGHWAFVRPWGWSWVDDAPWGFAPFHYGRWVWFRNAWCWAPGTYVAQPVYAPALVAWVGGPRVSVSISIGGGSPAPTVGWFPLAPREVYVPSYRVSPGYVQNVNVTHVTNITNITTIINNPQAAVSGIDYTNRKFPHAVTVVPQSVLTTRQPVAPAAAQWREVNRSNDEREARGRGDRRDRVDPLQMAATALAAAPVAAPVAVRRDAQRTPEAAVPGAPRNGVAPAPAGTPSPNATAPTGTVPVPPPPSRMNRPAVRAAEESGATRAMGAPNAPQAPQAPIERQGRDRREDGRQAPLEVRTPLPAVVPVPPARAVSPVVAAPSAAAVVPPAPARMQPPPIVIPAPAAPPPAAQAPPAPRVIKSPPPVTASRDAVAPAAVPLLPTVVPASPAAEARAGRGARPSQGDGEVVPLRPVPAVPHAAGVPPVAPVSRGESIPAQRRAEAQRSPTREGEHASAAASARDAAAADLRKAHIQEKRGEPRERGQNN